MWVSHMAHALGPLHETEHQQQHKQHNSPPHSFSAFLVKLPPAKYTHHSSTLGVSTRHEHMASTAPTTPAAGISADYTLTATASDIEARQVNAMSKTMNARVNPFMDPAAEQEAAGDEAQFSVDSTLAVGKNASLTLGTDSLIVLGMSHGAEARGRKGGS